RPATPGSRRPQQLVIVNNLPPSAGAGRGSAGRRMGPPPGASTRGLPILTGSSTYDRIVNNSSRRLPPPASRLPPPPSPRLRPPATRLPPPRRRAGNPSQEDPHVSVERLVRGLYPGRNRGQAAGAAHLRPVDVPVPRRRGPRRRGGGLLPAPRRRALA